MPKYNITQCLTNTPYIVSASTLTLGESISFNIGEDLFCGIVGDETTNPITPLSLFGSTFADCCECLSAITEFLNFRFITCDSFEQIDIESINFCSQYGVPLTGRTYEIQFGSDPSFCATFQELSLTGQTNYFYVSGPFNNCNNCQNQILTTISAGTEYIGCYTCDGVTQTIILPHPVWTDLTGNDVILMDAVQLGGMNGLNS
jgi:hypothetical protein